MLFLEGKLGNIPSKILLDTGANVNLAGRVWWDKWKATKRSLHLSAPDCKVSGAHSRKTLSLLGSARLPICFGDSACAPFTFFITTDFEGEVLLGCPTLKAWGSQVNMTGGASKISFGLFPGRTFTEYIPPPAEALLLTTRESYVVTPIDQKVSIKTEWLPKSVLQRIIETKPYTLSDKIVHELSSTEIHRLRILTGNLKPTLVLLSYAPKSLFYEFLDSLVAAPLLIEVKNEVKVLGMVGEVGTALKWRKVLASKDQLKQQLEEKLLSWLHKTSTYETLAEKIATHIINLVLSDTQPTRWTGVADHEDLDDDECYVPTKTPVKPRAPKNTLDNLLPKMKFGPVASVGMKRDTAQALLENEDILLSHNTAKVRNFEYRILLKDDDPIFIRRRQSDIELKFLNQEVAQMVADGIACETDPGHAPYVSPPLLVPKKGPDGKFTEKRFCIDYQKLNKKTIKDKYNLPNLETCLHMREGIVFSKVDLKSAFWQIPIHPEDQIKTGFYVDNKIYYFKFLPFGLTNAPACMQRLIDKVLTGVRGVWAYGYIDDIIIYSKSVEDHLAHLKDLFKRLKHFGLRIGLSKCEFFTKEMIFLGHLISHGEVRIDPSKIDGVRNFPVPETVPQLQSFLGLSGWCRRFIYDYSTLAAPLTNLLKKDAPWVWGLPQMRSFENIKKRIVERPILAQPDYSRPFILECDASNYGIGAALFQDSVAEEIHPICFISRKLISAEKNYSTREREFLSIVWACDRLKQFLWGREFTVFTDHKSLTWVFTPSQENSRINRWVRKLSPFTFEIKFKSGASNVVADALSRNPVYIIRVLPKSFHIHVLTRAQQKGEKKKSEATDKKEGPKPIPEKEVKTPKSKAIPDAKQITVEVKAKVPDSKIEVMDVSPDDEVQQEDRKEIRQLEPKSDVKHPAPPPPVPPRPVSSDLPAVAAKQYPVPLLDKKFFASVDGPYPLPDISSWKINLKMDSEYKDLIMFLENKLHPMGHSLDVHAKEKLKRLSGFFEYSNGLLYFKKSIPAGEDTFLLEVPTIFRRDLIRVHHDPPTSGHRGRDATLKAIKKYYHWPSMSNDVDKYVKDCLTCFLTKTPDPKNKGLLATFEVEILKFQVIHVDFVGPLPTTPSGNTCIFSIRDRGSGLYWGTPTKGATAEEAASILWCQWIARYGVPHKIITDKGPAFMGEVFNNTTKLMGINITHTTSYHPQSNGSVERDHRTLKAFLRSYCLKNPRDWDKSLAAFNFVINNTPRRQVGYTPNFIIFGLNPRPPTVLFDKELSVVATEDLVSEMLFKLENVQNELNITRAKLQKEYKTNFDKHHQFQDLQVGDLVYRKHDKPPTGTVRKFWVPWRGPFRIVKILENKVTAIISNDEGVEESAHTSKLVTFRRPLHEDPDLIFRDLIAQSEEILDRKDEESSPPVSSEPLRVDTFVITKLDEKSHDLWKIISITPPLGWRYKPAGKTDSGPNRLYNPVWWDPEAQKFDYITSKRMPQYVEVTEQIQDLEILITFGSLQNRKIPSQVYDKFIQIHGIAINIPYEM